MFYTARLKLTAWYLLILMVISIIFSAIIYTIVSRQIESIFHKQNDRIRRFKIDIEDGKIIPLPPRDMDELENQKEQLMIDLFIINGAILLVAGGAAYFLAGRTLRPIQQMVDEQNQFITDSSHELRTPIATMRTEMETSLLEKHISDKRARELITSNLEELDSLQSLTNNLLTLSHYQTINQTSLHEKVWLAETLESAIKKVMPLANKKKITIEKNLKDASIIGDKASLVETFVIFLENAIKYSNEQSSISIVMQKYQHCVKVVIEDHGVGIAEDDLPHIFERFYRADRSRSQDGFGLGLSIAKKTIEAHDGTILVESTIGKGSVFIITLPIRKK